MLIWATLTLCAKLASCPAIPSVAQIVVREWSDGIWGRGAAAMTLRDLYGAPWGTTGPARHHPRSLVPTAGDLP